LPLDAGVRSRLCKSNGYTAVELLMVIAIAAIAAGISMPMLARTNGDLKLQNDARAIHNMVSLAKMRAATRSARVRFFADLGSETFYLQWYDRANAKWVTEDGSRTLSANIDFGHGSASTPPPSTQSAIDAVKLCRDDAGTTEIPNTACVVFNSRGIPVNHLGEPDGNAGFYLTDGTGVYGVTVSATPLVRLWWTPASKSAWTHK
jgi:prepilin-type N-terminal cleavage/methylation domain-containing protein